MRNLLALVFLTTALAVTFSVPITSAWETKCQLPWNQMALSQQDSLSRVSLLPHKLKDSNNPLGSQNSKVIQKKVKMAFSPVMNQDDLYRLLQGILNTMVQVIQKLADDFYNLFRPDYGINNPIFKKMQKFADVIRQISYMFSANRTSSCILHDEDRLLIISISNQVNDIVDYFWKIALVKAKLNISDCPVSSKVKALDGLQTLFVIYKKILAQFACIFLKRLDNNFTVSDITKASYKNYFDVIYKLYESETLNKEEDKIALKKSMDFFLEQLNEVQLNSGAKKALTQLIHIFIKLVTGEKFTIPDRILAIKNGIIMMMGFITGSTDILLQDKRVAILYQSLFPIVAKIGMSEYFKACKRRGKELSYLSRAFLTNTLPLFKEFVSYLLHFVGGSPAGISPRQNFNKQAIEKIFNLLLTYLNQLMGRKPGKLQEAFHSDIRYWRAPRKAKTIVKQIPFY